MPRFGSLFLVGGCGKSAHATPELPRQLIVPVYETVRFRFVKPESLIHNRLKEKAFSTHALMFGLHLSTAPLRGAENASAGFILYYL